MFVEYASELVYFQRAVLFGSPEKALTWRGCLLPRGTCRAASGGRGPTRGHWCVQQGGHRGNADTGAETTFARLRGWQTSCSRAGMGGVK